MASEMVLSRRSGNNFTTKDTKGTKFRKEHPEIAQIFFGQQHTARVRSYQKMPIVNDPNWCAVEQNMSLTRRDSGGRFVYFVPFVSFVVNKSRDLCSG